MVNINDLQDLRSFMCITPTERQSNISDRFNDIASFLINRCSVEYKDIHYRFFDLEFYFFNDNHRDISVHPRNSKAMTWYINDFGGIDLNFESKIETVRIEKNHKVTYKYNLTEDSYFGGILIRQLKNLSTGEVLDGPWKVADLFRETDALSHNQQNPIIVLDDHENADIKELKRFNLFGASKDAVKKAQYNLDSCFANSYLDANTLAVELDRFNNIKYRFTIG